MTVCEVWRLGTTPYEEAWALQRQLAQPDAPDRLLLLSHPHTFTLGTAADEGNLVWDADERARRAVSVYRIDRGGDVTYHGPGQLVAYPILNLRRYADSLPLGPDGIPARLGAVDYLRKLEQVILATLADYRIVGKTIPGLTGVWVDTPLGEEKIAAIGVKVTVRAITQHGFAINLNTDLGYFEGIVPCGIRDKGVTSLAQILGEAVDEAYFADRLVQHFGVIFGYEMIAASR
ncbi:MAG: lipoyl(octanoyl) transferase LipB [Chloroflexi bacterium]|nr:lipoyl(octanoyl) transferase LipB [Chloroflexota bacterium]